MGVETEKDGVAAAFEGEEGGDQLGTGLALGSDAGAACAHVNFEEDEGCDTGGLVEGLDGWELGWVVDHYGESGRAECFGDER